MDLPVDIAALIGDLEGLGFELTHKSDAPWPGGPQIELRRASGGVRGVRMSVDRGVWEVEVKVGRSWYEPYWAVRVLENKPDERRALSHSEQRTSTLNAIQRISGDRAERRQLTKSRRGFERAYTRWAQGKGPQP